jgi:hypothetical protein
VNARRDQKRDFSESNFTFELNEIKYTESAKRGSQKTPLFKLKLISISEPQFCAIKSVKFKPERNCPKAPLFKLII